VEEEEEEEEEELVVVEEEGQDWDWEEAEEPPSLFSLFSSRPPLQTRTVVRTAGMLTSRMRVPPPAPC
jgi:hypothetical protein